MPLPIAAKAGIVAISVAVAVAIAVYESPEVRRRADELRRRIAIAIQSLGENISPDDLSEQQRRRQSNSEPIFNRPEDAEGFLVSRGGSNNPTADPGVVADDETRRRQREELMYWNRVQMQKKKDEEKQRQRQQQQQQQQQQQAQSQAQTQAPKAESWQPREALEAMQRATRDAAAAAGIYMSSLGGPQLQPRSRTSFDQFLRPDHNAERGTYVVNTGADMTSNAAEAEELLNSGLLRRRRPEGVRGLNASVYANPFGDEHGIELDDHHTIASSSNHGSAGPSAAEAFNAETAYLISPDRDETMSDIYNATEPDTNGAAAAAAANHMDAVFDPLPAIPEAVAAPSQRSASVRTVSEVPTSEVFFDVNDYTNPGAADTVSQLSLRLERALAENDGYITAGQDHADREGDEDELASSNNNGAFDSIQAWAQSSSAPGFYSPLPVTPSVTTSEPSVISAGDLTPVDSMSAWGDDHSVIDHADADEEMAEAQEARDDRSWTAAAAPSQSSATVAASSDGSRTAAAETPAAAPAAASGPDYDVLSEDEDGEGVLTPTSWSEVGSVVSESDAGPQPMHA